MDPSKEYSFEDTSSAKLQASKEGVRKFTESGMGLSVHWGVYSLCHKSNEWIYFDEKIPLKEYQKLARTFDPVRFSADEWADLMVEAGFKFLIITTKHHDGFCLFDSKLTDFKVTNTVFKRDVIAELAKALHDRGLGLHFYYSLADWTHPAYRKNWPSYVKYYQGQVRELCTNYGAIDGVIFDGYWANQKFNTEIEAEYWAPRGKWDFAGTYDLVHTLQPNAVLASNHHTLPNKGEDYQVWEVDLPGENKTGFNCAETGNKPTASWWNVNAGWSYQPWNHKVKSAADLLKLYSEVRKRNGVFFLNVGPRPFGDIHPEEQAVLREFGKLVKAK